MGVTFDHFFLVLIENHNFLTKKIPKEKPPFSLHTGKTGSPPAKQNWCS